MQSPQQEQPQTDPLNVAPSHIGVPVETLESLRLRLTQLTHSLNKLSMEVKNAQMPQWVSLQTQFSIILTQLASLSQALRDNEALLEQTVVYPLPSFPTTEQEGLLTTLLRKKLVPEVTAWIQDSKTNTTDISLADDESLMEWATKQTASVLDEMRARLEAMDTYDKEIKAVFEERDGVGRGNGSAGRGMRGVDEVLKFMFQGVLPEGAK